jgi:F-type H+-transporting ATPase subunit delta
MEASTRVALAQARERLGEQSEGAAGPALLKLADELFAVARLLGGQLSLRRALSDPAGKPDERAGLARRLFETKVSAATLDLVETIARLRWSHPIDLADAASTLAIEASLDAADARGELDSVEDELFRFGRIVGGDRELTASSVIGRLPPRARRPCSTPAVREGQPDHRAAVAQRADRAAPRLSDAAIERLSDQASRRRGQSIARVTSAVALTAAQEQRLTEVLGRLYGRTIGCR